MYLVKYGNDVQYLEVYGNDVSGTAYNWYIYGNTYK